MPCDTDAQLTLVYLYRTQVERQRVSQQHELWRRQWAQLCPSEAERAALSQRIQEKVNHTLAEEQRQLQVARGQAEAIEKAKQSARDPSKLVILTHLGSGRPPLLADAELLSQQVTRSHTHPHTLARSCLGYLECMVELS